MIVQLLGCPPNRDVHVVDDDTVASLDRPELVAEVGGAARPVLDRAGHGMFDCAAHVVGDSGIPQVGDRLPGDPQELPDDLLTAPALVRRMPGQRAEQGGPETVDVRLHRRWPSFEHLRRGERRGPGDRACRRLESAGDAGDAEVGQLRLVVFGEQDVRGFDVAVEHPTAMRGLEGSGHLDPEPQHLLPPEGTRPTDLRIEGTERVVRHDEERPPAPGHTDLVDGNDVRVPGRAAHRPLLADEPRHVVGVEVRRQDLDGHRAVEVLLQAAVDDPEPAAADLHGIVEPCRGQLGRDLRLALGCPRIVVRHRPCTTSDTLHPE